MEARAERRSEIAEDRLRGRLLDPEASKPGHKKVRGRTRGSKIAYKGTHKPAEAPTLRRDPPAYEKMALMRRWERAAEERGCSVKGLPSEDCSASSNSAKLVLVVPQLITGSPAMSVVLSGDESRFREMRASSAPVSNKAKDPWLLGLVAYRCGRGTHLTEARLVSAEHHTHCRRARDQLWHDQDKLG